MATRELVDGGVFVTLGAAYDTLGLDPSSSTPDAIRTAFRALVLTNHPDVFLDESDKKLANETLRTIVEAYETLKIAGFPRLEPRAATDVYGTFSQAGPSGFAWETQRDSGDTEFDEWERSFFEGSYARSIRESGHAAALTHRLWLGIWGLFIGGTFLALALSKGMRLDSLPLAALMLAFIALCLRYLISPAIYYGRRHFDEPQSYFAAWPDSARWVLLIPTIAVAFAAGTAIGESLRGLLHFAFHRDYDVVFLIEDFLVAAFVAASARYVAPRFSLLVGIVAGGGVVGIDVFSLAVLLSHDATWKDAYVQSLVISTVASTVGAAAGCVVPLPMAQSRRPISIAAPGPKTRIGTASDK